MEFKRKKYEKKTILSETMLKKKEKKNLIDSKMNERVKKNYSEKIITERK